MLNYEKVGALWHTLYPGNRCIGIPWVHKVPGHVFLPDRLIGEGSTVSQECQLGRKGTRFTVNSASKQPGRRYPQNNRHFFEEFLQNTKLPETRVPLLPSWRSCDTLEPSPIKRSGRKTCLGTLWARRMQIRRLPAEKVCHNASHFLYF